MIFGVCHLPTLDHVHAHELFPVIEESGAPDIVWKDEKGSDSHDQSG